MDLKAFIKTNCIVMGQAGFKSSIYWLLILTVVIKNLTMSENNINVSFKGS